jgi:hypothetical protein
MMVGWRFTCNANKLYCQQKVVIAETSVSASFDTNKIIAN